MRNKFPTYISEKTLKHYYAFTNAGVPAIWTPPRFGPPGPNPLVDMDSPGPNPLADMDSPGPNPLADLDPPPLYETECKHHPYIRSRKNG